MLRGAPGEKGGSCMQGANGTEQRRLCGMYMLYFAGYMAFFSFYALYLTQYGFSRQALGVISSGTAAANLAALILSGLLADHVLSPKKIVLAGSLISALWGLLLLRATGSLGAALLAVVPVSFFDFALMGMLDAWTSLAARRNSRVQYSVARGLGGLAGAAASLVLGHLLPLAGTGRLVWFHLGFYLLLFLAACRARGTALQGRVQPGGKLRGTRLWSGRYLLFLTAALLVFLGWRALLTYLPSMVVELGGGSRQQGFLMAEMSLCSMAAMGLYPRLRRRLGVRAFLLAGAAFMAVRVLCMAFVRTLPALAAVQLFEAVSYGFFQPAALEYVSAVTPPEGRATALGIYTAAQMPAGTILANAIAVPALGAGSLRAVFLLFSALALAGLARLLFLLFRAGPYAAAQKEAV